MLKPDEAKKRLRAFRTHGDRAERARELSPALRPLAFGLLKRGPEGEKLREYEPRQAALRAAVAGVEGLSRSEREELFAALLPRLGGAVERAWRLLGERPYELGEFRRAFRAPGDDAAVRESRTAWIEHLLEVTSGWEHEAEWFAAWAPYLPNHYWSGALFPLLAAAIDGGGPEGEAVFAALAACVRGEHEVGTMGRHVTGALLCASRPDGWELVERLLLAAQRQEGLRQTILESVDEAHPEAFRRMLRLMLDHDLLRFAAAVRALDVWFGFEYETVDGKGLRATAEDALRFLEDPSVRETALQGEDAHRLYLALWATAYEDAHAAVPLAARRLEDRSVECRFAAAALLGELRLDASRQALLPATDDPDLRVALRAATDLAPEQSYGTPTVDMGGTDLFERLERLLSRLPKKAATLPALVWPWGEVRADRTEVSGWLLRCLGARGPKRLIPHLPAMAGYTRAEVIRLLARLKSDPEVRATLFGLAGDTQEYVRGEAQRAIAKLRVSEAEAQGLERLLTRKAADLRRGLLSLLLNQPDERVLASADRLAGASDALQRQAGLELMQQLVQAERAVDACHERAGRYRATRAAQSETETALLAQIEGVESQAPTLDNALGLLDPSQRTPGVEPREVDGLVLLSDAARAMVTGLEGLVRENREVPIRLATWDGSEQEALLGDIGWGFPDIQAEVPLEKDAERLPLRERWESWWDERPAGMRDADGFELLRALAGLEMVHGISTRVPVIPSLLRWLLRLRPPAGESVDFLLDAAETSIAQVPPAVREKKPKPDNYWEQGWRGDAKRVAWVELARLHRSLHPSAWRPEHHAHFWRLLRWVDEPGLDLPRFRPELEDVVAALEAGAATEADLIDQLLGARFLPEGYSYAASAFEDLHRLTGRRPDPLAVRCPALAEVVERCRRRIVEVELRRGDLPTAASLPALALRHAGGAGTFVSALGANGTAPFVRGATWGNLGKAVVLSHLLRATFPAADDSPEEFAGAVQQAGISTERLIEAAFYAPQWAAYVQRALDWPGFEAAVWWIHAHTKDTQWAVDEDVKAHWAAEVSERTPLVAQSLLDGAVDVAWFRRIQAELGPDRWQALDAPARYASGGAGHRRAQLFADAMLGRLAAESLTAQVRAKRSQDALRALGLVPLPEGEGREAEVLARYQVLQEFVRGSRQFGAQRQASEKLAMGIALENLARTAGYPDPIRLEWAMEASEIADLAGGPLTATAGEVTVTLSLNAWGEPGLSVVKGARTLKAIPPAVKKDPAVAALVERKRQVERQAARTRRSLEEAMCRGDRFTPQELRDLSEHPVLAPMLRNLVFALPPEGDPSGAARPLGYPVAGGRELEAPDGSRTPLGAGEELVLAHPHDLLQSGEWHLWQQDCFRRERIQPFKQVFRELYVLTAAERETGTGSERYAGHQVNRSQAMALLGQRGWVASADEGRARRTFHREGLTAWVEFDGAFGTPAEVGGLTLDAVGFSRRGEWESLPLAEIPPRLFSETMRDVDLVVSVAHAGGVDPEATASTVEMRAALVRELARLLKLENVRFQSAHVLIDGHLATYSVHLGSAVVHRQPGGHLCIVPVHAQERGRLFLPFADDDPRTAEVMAKVLLLARDREIQDPTILEQILPGR